MAETKPDDPVTRSDFDKLLHALDDKKIDKEEVSAFWNVWSKVWPIIVLLLGFAGITFTTESARVPLPVVKEIAEKVDALTKAKAEPPSPVKLTIDVPDKIEATIGGMPATVTAKSAGKLTWLLPPSSKCSGFETTAGFVIVPQTGAVDFDMAVVATNGDEVVSKWLKVHVKGGNGPQPPPPVPTEPTIADVVTQIGQLDSKLSGQLSNLDARVKALEKVPSPKPDPPAPTDKGPFGGAPGLHVLIVYERTGEPLTSTQTSIIYGKQFRDYIAAKAAKGPDGTPQRRIWDKDIDTSAAEKVWQDAMKRPRTSDFWIAVGNGTQWFEGPLPGTVEETMALLKKFGG